MSALTYEGVLEMFKETDRLLKEQGAEFTRLLRERGAEFDRGLKEQGAGFTRMLKERGDEFDRLMKERDAEYDRLRKETNRKIGDISSSIGRIVEHMLGERIIEKFQALGYGVTHPVRRNHSFENTKLGISGEFDLTLVDSDVIILIEVKTTLETADVRKHVKKIEEYRRHIVSVGFVQPPFTHLLPSTRFIGAVAGAVVEEEAINFAHENGLYTIVQSGETVEIVKVPDSFKVREW
jgi:hypothetical protein